MQGSEVGAQRTDRGSQKSEVGGLTAVLRPPTSDL